MKTIPVTFNFNHDQVVGFADIKDNGDTTITITSDRLKAIICSDVFAGLSLSFAEKIRGIETNDMLSVLANKTNDSPLAAAAKDYMLWGDHGSRRRFIEQLRLKN